MLKLPLRTEHDQRAVAELGTLRGSAAFTVGSVGGEVRITLR